ncbi:MAG: CHAT domain-containing protein [Deltaproteobacteria bacterium]|nr:CHAT domain-containing protein [Deltaproteobacteria bacterium]
MKARSSQHGNTFSNLVMSLLLVAVWASAADPTRTAPGDEAAFGEARESRSRPGVVVVEVSEGSAPAKAGLEAGDVVIAWARSLINSAESGTGRPGTMPSKGQLGSVFDWLWLETEQAPRGLIQLLGERDGERMVLEVGVGRWDVKVRPRMSPAFLEPYLEGKELIEAGNLASGTALWQELADMAPRRGDEGDEALQCWLRLRIGEVWAEERAWEKTHSAYQLALEAAREPVAQVAVWDMIGKSYKRQNKVAEAEASYRSALVIRQATWGESLGVAISLNNLGTVAWFRSDLEQAAEHYKRSLGIREQLAPGSLQVAGSLNNLGIVARSRGDLERAAEHYQRAFEIREHLAPGSLQVANILNNLGNVALTRGDLEQAAEHYQRALEIYEKFAPRSLQVAASLNNLGNVALTRGDLEQAVEHHQRGLEIRDQLAPGSLQVAASLNNLGNVALTRGDLEQAAEHYQRALEIQEQLAPGSLEIAKTLSDSGKVARQQGEPEQAAAFFDRSMAALEAQMGKLGGSHDLQGRFRAKYRTIYRDSLELYLELDQPEEAFNILERSRARTFLAMLTERDVNFSADASTELDRARRRLATRHDRLLHQMMGLSQTQDQDKVEAFTRELQDLRLQHEETMEAIRRASPKLAALQDPKPLDLQSIRESLDPGTVLLSYSVGEKESHLFVVTRAGALEVHPLPGLKSLKGDVESFRNLIQDRSFPTYRRAMLDDLSNQLYKALVEPAKEWLESSERALILPDGPLHLLPFGALVREPGTDPTTPGQFLVEWKPLHFALSGTVYAEIKNSRPATAQEGRRIALAAFGDPRYPQHFGSRNEDPIGDVRLRSAVERNLFDFQPLPFTRHEVEEIARLFPKSTQTYLGLEATEERAKALNPKVRFVHFAAHAYSDDRDPLSSAVVLTIPEQLTDDRDNGLLQVWEIFERLRLDAELVVLSACETGLGETQGGDGLISLSRAFQYAGARTVAASLWRVPDRETAQLMLHFYRRLVAGQPKDAALRGAQLSLIRDPIQVTNRRGELVKSDASAPYYWAAFQIYGDWW